MLILRTKGGMFEKRPIIPLFHVSGDKINVIISINNGLCNFRVCPRPSNV